MDRDGYRLAARWMPTDRLTLDYSFSNDTIDERSQMLNIVGLNPTNASVLFESGFPITSLSIVVLVLRRSTRSSVDWLRRFSTGSSAARAAR